MRLVITGILMLIILIMVCSLKDKEPDNEVRCIKTQTEKQLLQPKRTQADSTQEIHSFVKITTNHSSVIYTKRILLPSFLSER